MYGFVAIRWFVNTFSMRHDKDNELFSDDIHVVYVELSKLEDVLKKSVSEMTEIEKWSVFFHYANKQTHREIVNKTSRVEKKLFYKLHKIYY